jgi:pimeloyl-ACP methyl ester carboxylesterase
MGYLGNDYRTYALDFWGFGESGKKLSTYEVSEFVSLVDQFMDALGIENAPVVGHSMGGTVGLLLSIQYPHRVSSVTVIGSPIVGKSLALMLKLAGYRPIAVMVHNMMWALKLGIRLSAPVITSDKRWYNMIDQDLSRTTVESFLTSISSLHQTDLTEALSQIRVPTMGIYGHKDVIVNPNQWKPLQSNVPNVRIERFPEAGHFPMLDQPRKFQETLRNFLDTSYRQP